MSGSKLRFSVPRKNLNIFLIATSLWWRTPWWHPPRTQCENPLETLAQVYWDLRSKAARTCWDISQNQEQDSQSLTGTLCLQHTQSPNLPGTVRWHGKAFPDLPGNEGGKKALRYVALVSWENTEDACLHGKQMKPMAWLLPLRIWITGVETSLLVEETELKKKKSIFCHNQLSLHINHS